MVLMNQLNIHFYNPLKPELNQLFGEIFSLEFEEGVLVYIDHQNSKEFEITSIELVNELVQLLRKDQCFEDSFVLQVFNGLKHLNGIIPKSELTIIYFRGQPKDSRYK